MQDEMQIDTQFEWCREVLRHFQWSEVWQRDPIYLPNICVTYDRCAYHFAGWVGTTDLDEAFGLSQEWEDRRRTWMQDGARSTSIGDLLCLPDASVFRIMTHGFCQLENWSGRLT